MKDVPKQRRAISPERERLAVALQEALRHEEDGQHEDREGAAEDVALAIETLLEKLVQEGVKKRLQDIFNRAAQYENRSARETELLQDLVDCTESE